MEIFGRARKSPEIFGKTLENSSKVFCRCFYDFFKLSENLRKSSEVFEIFENFWKTSETVQK